MKKSIIRWWNSENILFSTFTNEHFTNREVITLHIGCIAILLLAFLFGGVE